MRVVTAPGWYQDATGQMRWWDGQQWTGQTATPWAAPGPVAATPQRGPSYAWSVPPLLLGLVLVVVGLSHGLPDFSRTMSGPRLTAPGEASVELDRGPWTLFERTGSSSGGGGFTFTENDGVTFGPDQVSVDGPAPVARRTDLGNGTETLNRNGDVYTGAVRIEVPQKGVYTVRIADTGAPPRAVMIVRPVSYSFRHVAPLAVVALGVLLVVIGGVLLVIRVARRRRV